MVAEEKGKTKRGNNYTVESGKLTREDYIVKFNKTDFNFSR